MLTNTGNFVYSKNTRTNALDVAMNNSQTSQGIMKNLLQAGAYQADLWNGKPEPIINA
jgi:hypothetical protein